MSGPPQIDAAHVLVRRDLVHGPFGEDPALVQHRHPLRDLADEGDVVLDDDDGEPGPFRCWSTRAVCSVSSGDMPAVGSSSSRMSGPPAQHHGDLQPLQLVVRQLAARADRASGRARKLQGIAIPLLGGSVDARPARMRDARGSAGPSARDRRGWSGRSGRAPAARDGTPAARVTSCPSAGCARRPAGGCRREARRASTCRPRWGR